MADAKFHLMRFDSLANGRGNWDSQWEEAARRIVPGHVNSFSGRGLDLGAGGQKNTEEMIDATACIAAQRFMAVMESLNTPQSSIWHLLKPVDKMLRRNRSVRMWFDDVNEILFNYRYRPVGNFIGNSQQCYQSLGVYGNMVLFIDQPEDEPGLRYRNIHLGEAYFVSNHAGVVDTLYRRFYLTARAAVQRFPQGLPDQILVCARDAKRMEEKFEFIHCVFPRGDYDPRNVTPSGMKYASLYIARIDARLIEEGGYRSFPYAVGRYTQHPNEDYGRGPAQWVLPSIKTLNAQKKTVLKQGHRAVDPVLLAHNDGALDGFSLRSGALNKGGINKDGKRMVDILPTGNLAVGDKMMEMERVVIQDAFLITLFQILVDSPQKTATEVLELAREKGMLVAPTAGRLQAEFQGPMIGRELDLLIAQGLLPPPPRILLEAGANYKVEYDAPMSRMQRAEQASGFNRALAQASEYAKVTQDPEPLDWFNFDIAMPAILDISGSPTAWTRSEEDVLARREGRAKAMQQQQMVEAAPSIAAVAKAAPDIQRAAA